MTNRYLYPEKAKEYARNWNAMPSSKLKHNARRKARWAKLSPEERERRLQDRRDAHTRRMQDPEYAAMFTARAKERRERPSQREKDTIAQRAYRARKREESKEALT